MLNDATGSYRGKVTAVNDPTNSRKIKLQCPQIAGQAELQWAEPANLLDPIPNPGDLVWVFFNGGDTTKPVYSVISDPFQWVAPTLNAGWAFGPASGSVQPLRYKTDGSSVRIFGSVHTTTTTPSATMFTLPVISSLLTYRPAIEERVGVTYNNAGVISHILCQVLSNGNVTLSPNPSSNNADVYFNVWFPLGSLG